MIAGKSVLALIPARGGSKGLPGKNVRMLCGKPLIAWSIDKAKCSRYLDTILVTTDSEEIAAVAKAQGADVPFLRPAEYATDTASTYDAIRHALRFLRDERQREYDYVVLLEPTAPLRDDDDVDRMLEQLVARADEFDTIVSVGEVTEHPSIMKRLDGTRITPFTAELQQTSRRQDNQPAYYPYGIAYIAKTATLLEENTFYSKRCTYHVIKRYQNFDIDDIYDFVCVERVMMHEWGMK
ncbi:acylneuraminate cytidylyltransferase family protein [bacterium]|nr:acylneuraminate cytidylyltransferase family protein [bacterium]